jgi:hypothetical protein
MNRRLLSASVAAAITMVSRLMAQGLVPTPMIQVRVVDEQGMVIETGRASIDSLKRWSMIEHGTATIADLPSGKWNVVVSVPGFARDSVTLEAALHPSTIPELKLHRTTDVIPEEHDTVTFLPSARDSSLLREIDTRMRTAHGTLLKYDHPSVLNAQRASDPVVVARGFRWGTINTIRTTSGCVTLARSDTVPRRGMPTIAIYVDGNRTPSSIEAVNRMVPTRDILAIEAYPDMASAPFRWRSTDACAVLAFWTKRP